MTRMEKILAYELAQKEPGLDHNHYGVRMQVWDDCCYAVAKVLAEGKPHFSRSEFLEMCRYDYWKSHQAPN